ALALVAVPSASRADRRYYGQTYNAVTAPKGSLDVELWTTYYDPPNGAAAGTPSLWRHQLELETGITDRWDVAVYGIARQIESEDPEFESVKLETRYALAPPGAWPVDTVLYFEAKKTFVDEKPWSIEEKVILGKDLGRLNLSLNAAVEQEFEEGEVKWEGSYALGSSWELIPALRLGAEVFGVVEKEEIAPGEEELEGLVWAGPAASIAVGHAWLVLAAGFGLTDDSDALRARAVLAFQF
ncbi:MAG TPA: hypothetical protein VLL75_06795, partial [Vicinamibacteria bacterium]|nr:hypothetical protein [Vicinamibacteria bacterium]